MDRYTREQHDFIVSIAHGKKYREIADIYNKKYGTNKSRQAILSYCHKHNISNGITSKGTQFKKGHGALWNQKRLGYERYNKFNDVLVKVRNHGESHVMWRLKKELIWEKYYGKKPKNYKVMSLNGNKEDFNIENLMLCTTAEYMTLSKKNYITTDRTLTLSALYYIRLRRLRKQREMQLTGKKRIRD